MVLGASTRRRRPRHRRFHVPVVLVMPAASPCHPWPYCSPFPPHEQLLTAAIQGAIVVMVSVHPCLLSHCPYCEQELAAVVWA